MLIFRWIIGTVAALLLVLTVLGYGIGIAFNNEVWQERGRLFRQYLWIVALLWFNTEVWGRVAWTIITWNRG